DRLRTIFAEGQPDWLEAVAKADASPDEVISLLNTQSFFDLLKVPYPTPREGVLSRLSGEGLIFKRDAGWSITNLAALLLAKRLDLFDRTVARKAVRFVVYDGVNKLKTKTEVLGSQGYAVGFESLVDYVHNAAPR